jgi:hypothetical protein
MLEEKVDCHIPVGEITPGVILDGCFEFIRLAAEIGIPRAGNFKMKFMRGILTVHSELLRPGHVQLILKVYPMGHKYCELIAEAVFDEFIRDKTGGKFSNELENIFPFQLLVHAVSKRNVVKITYVHPLTEKLVSYEMGPDDYIIDE